MEKYFFHGINHSIHSAKLVAASWLVAYALSSDAVQYLEVKGDRVNLRAAAKADAEVVGQVCSTDTLILQGDLAEPWVKVTPPDSVDFWIYANLVKDGKVTVNNAQVRAGAGLNFNVVGQLQSGDAIVLRGKVGDWLKIAPFPASAVWVTNAYVSLKEIPNPEPVEPAPTTPPPQSVAPLVAISSSEPVESSPELLEPSPEPVEPSPATTAIAQPVIETPPSQPPAIPRPIADQILAQSADPVNPVSGRGSWSAPPLPHPLSVADLARSRATTSKPASRTLFGSKTTEDTVGPAAVPASRLRKDRQQTLSGSYAGTLALAPSGTHPTQYRLVSFTPDNKPRTLCYVLGNSRQLDSLKGGFFSIEGAVYWFEGTSLPTVYAQNILRHQQL